MKQFFTVFKFEFINFIKNKIFVGLTLVLAIVIAIVAFFPRLANGKDISLNFGDDTIPSLLIVNNSGDETLTDALKSALVDYEITVEKYDLEKAKELVTNEEYKIAIVIDSPLKYNYVVDNLGLYDTTSYIIDEILLSSYKMNYLANAGLSNEEIDEFSSAFVTSESIIVGQDQTQSFFHAYLLMMVLYMAVLIYGQLVAQSVATEKSSRAMELLITSANPKSLIFGKVIGTGVAGLAQITVLLLWGVICIVINKEYLADNEVMSMFMSISPSVIVYTVVFFVLGFGLYAFLNGAMGSMASKLEDVGTLTMPVMFTFIVSFVITIAFMSADNIDNPFINILSYIPFTAPMAMFARICMGTASHLEALASIVILIISIYGVGRLAVAIYRIGILMYGKPPKFNEIARALKKNK
ncbi:MAG: ABC transporter permease [Ruminococcaceae bacterium]|nr:ABC transporter permease [Oscillospiraceae bacterium]